MVEMSVGPKPARLMALVIMTVLSVFLIGLSHGDAGMQALSASEVSAAVPGALLSVALLLTLHLGLLDLSLLGLFAIALAVFGRASEVSDVRLVLVLVLTVLAAVGATTLGGRRLQLLLGLILFYLYSALAAIIGPRSATIVDTSGSRILAIVGNGATRHMVILALATGATWLLVNHTSMGRRARAVALVAQARRVPRWSTPVLGMRVWVGALIWLAAVVSLSRQGISGPPAEQEGILATLGAVLIAGGGASGLRPSAVRTVVTYLILSGIRGQMLVRGWNPGLVDLTVAIPAALSLILLSRPHFGLVGDEH